jgi:hypothetical protein
MMKPRLRAPFVTVLATTAMLGSTSCQQPATSPQDDTHLRGNPPPLPPDVAPSASSTNQGGPALPKWADIKSGHPEGGTNPPSAILTLARTGECFKGFAGGALRAPHDTKFETLGGRRYTIRIVPDVAAAKKRRAEVITCPDGAAEFLAAQPKVTPSATTPRIIRNPPRPRVPKPIPG